MGDFGSLMNYWVLAWLILHSHCQKSPSSSAANSHQTYFWRTFLQCSSTPPSFLLVLVRLHVVGRPAYQRWTCCRYSSEMLPVQFKQDQLFLHPAWSHFLFLFGPSDACVLVYRKTRHTHTCPETFLTSLHLSEVPHPFPFLAMKSPGQGANSDHAAAHQVFALRAALQDQNTAAFLLLNINFKRCFHEL